MQGMTRPTAPDPQAVVDAAMRLIAENPLFQLDQAEIRGSTYRVFKNAPASLGELFAACMMHGDSLAVVHRDTRWTFGDLYAKARAFAAGLQSRYGVGPGHKVALAMRNYPEWMVSYMGVIMSGAVVVPLNSWSTGPELEFMLTDVGANFVIGDAQRIDLLAGQPSASGFYFVSVRKPHASAKDTFDSILEAGQEAEFVQPNINTDDDYAVYYTSGSTGRPKGVVLTHRGAISSLLSFALVAESAKQAGGTMLGDRPAALLCLPLFHVTASHAVFMISLLAGQKMVMMDKWDADEAIRLINAEEITTFVGVPTMSHELMLRARETGETMPSLANIGSGGAKRPPAHVAELAKTFPHAWSSAGYGLSETNAMGTYNGMASYQAKPGAAGRPIPPVTDVKVVDPQGEPLKPGEAGEVWIRSPANFREYLNMPEETAATLTPDGWVRTGDVGVFDEDGFLTIVDRIKDMILRGGENISCLEVEGAIQAHPAVQEAAVFSIPDDRLGETVGAAIVLKPGESLTEGDLKVFLSDSLAAFKHPEKVWLRHEPLPRVGTGKLDKRATRSLVMDE